MHFPDLNTYRQMSNPQVVYERASKRTVLNDKLEQASRCPYVRLSRSVDEKRGCTPRVHDIWCEHLTLIDSYMTILLSPSEARTS